MTKRRKLFNASSLWKGSQPAFTCSKLTIETLEQGVKYVQSYNDNDDGIMNDCYPKLLTFLNPFLPNVLFLYPPKTSEIRGFLMFSGGIKREDWKEMG